MVSSLASYWLREMAEAALVVVALAVTSRFVHVPVWAWIALPLGKLLSSVVLYALALRRVIQRGPASGIEALIAAQGIAITPLNPHGHVKIQGEIWRAHAAEESAPIAAGTDIRVIGASGTRLEVRAAAPPDSLGAQRSPDLS